MDEDDTLSARDGKKVPRREFLRTGGKIVLGLAATALGVEGLRRGNEYLRDKGQLDLEQEIADGTLNQVKSAQLSQA